MKAEKLNDLLKYKSYWRYFKKGIAVGLLTGLSVWIINTLLAVLAPNTQAKLSAMVNVGSLGGYAIVVLTLAWVVYGILAGFVVEYVNHGSAKLLRWVNK